MGSVFAYAIAVLIVIIVCYQWLSTMRVPRGMRRLPGPWGLPVLGRVHDIDPTCLWVKIREWGHTYGPIFQWSAMGKTIIWITNAELARELLSKRGAIYADRPVIENVIGSKTNGEYLPLLGDNDAMHRQRKVATTMLAQASKAQYYNYPVLEVKRLLAMLLEDPVEYPVLLNEYTSRIASRLAWDAPHAAEAMSRNSSHLMWSISPAGALPNAIPILRHLPEWLSKWKRSERVRHEREQLLFSNLLQRTRNQISNGCPKPSFAQTYFHKKESNGIDEREAAYAVAILANASIMTIASPLRTFLMAMMLYPKWQLAVYEEIEELGGRMAEVADSPGLPILRAVIKECLRWKPPVRAGIPHVLQRDDEWNGYHLPKGSVVVASEWSMSRDPFYYPSPDEFLPERWLLPSFPTYGAPLTEYPSLKGYHGFGFGPRVCIGQGLAEAELLVACSAIIWGFEIKRALDHNGKPIPIDDEKVTQYVVSMPVVHPMNIEVRSAAKAKMIRKMYDDLDQGGEFCRRDDDQDKELQLDLDSGVAARAHLGGCHGLVG